MLFDKLKPLKIPAKVAVHFHFRQAGEIPGLARENDQALFAQEVGLMVRIDKGHRETKRFCSHLCLEKQVGTAAPLGS